MIVLTCLRGHYRIVNERDMEDRDEEFDADYPPICHAQKQLGTYEDCNLPLRLCEHPEELARLAVDASNEEGHKLADQAMFYRMKQLDPTFAAWYEKQRLDWWYA